MVLIELHRLAEDKIVSQRKDERLDRETQQVEALPDRVEAPPPPQDARRKSAISATGCRRRRCCQRVGDDKRNRLRDLLYQVIGAMSVTCTLSSLMGGPRCRGAKCAAW